MQNSESIAEIADKFGVSVKDLIKVNASKVHGKYPNAYFYAGEEIKIPRKIDADDSALQGRKSRNEVITEYEAEEEKRLEEARREEEAKKAEQAEEQATKVKAAKQTEQAQQGKQSEQVQDTKQVAAKVQENEISSPAEEKIKILKQSAKQIVEELMKAVRGYNDIDRIKNAIARIGTPEELAEVNGLLQELRKLTDIDALKKELENLKK